MAGLTDDDLLRLRLQRCVDKWPNAEGGEYNPRCCRFPKSCSPYVTDEEIRRGGVTSEDLEAPHKSDAELMLAWIETELGRVNVILNRMEKDSRKAALIRRQCMDKIRAAMSEER